MSATQNFGRILVATNGSEKASAAVERGVELAASQHAELVFLHVLPPTDPNPRLAFPSTIPRRISAPLEDEALQNAATRASEMGVEAQVELLSGDAAREIVSVAQMLDADLVIVGESGRNPLRKHVTPSVLRRAKRTVLVAKRGKAQAEAALPVRVAA